MPNVWMDNVLAGLVMLVTQSGSARFLTVGSCCLVLPARMHAYFVHVVSQVNRTVPVDDVVSMLCAIVTVVFVITDLRVTPILNALKFVS